MRHRCIDLKTHGRMDLDEHDEHCQNEKYHKNQRNGKTWHMHRETVLSTDIGSFFFCTDILLFLC